AREASAAAIDEAGREAGAERVDVPAEPQRSPVHDLALEAQKAAGWDRGWPFIPADLLNADFRKLIREDPTLTAGEKEKIFSAGKNLGVVPKSEGVEAPGKAQAAPVLDPVTQEAVGQAEEALTRLGDVKIENDNGEMVSATETLRRSIDDIKNAQGDGELHRVAAACFGRM
ncbi:MAG TPA: hypothetical protein VHQ21_05045, partial [Rhodanobacteraceae bacterium]|nr:hypothetical protein [Rhodanobacteraceae bacterium]